MKEPIESFYLHVPFCRHLCNYCDFYKKKFDDGSQAFIDFENNLMLQWERLKFSEVFKSLEVKPLKTLYLGGGTPSLWKNGSSFLVTFFSSENLSFADDYQATLEVDPASWDKESIDKWMKFGINRFSIGIQTLNPNLFPIVDRGYSFEQNLKTLEYFSKLGVDFSVDFLISLPESINKGREIESLYFNCGQRLFSLFKAAS